MEKINKREAAKIPRPKITKEMKAAAKKLKKKEGIMTSEQVQISGKDTLVVNAFKLYKGELQPFIRLFLQKDDDITQDLQTSNIRWQTSMWNKLAGTWYIPEWGRGELLYPALTEQDDQRIREFVSENMDHHDREPRLYFQHDYEDHIYMLQEDIRFRKRMCRHQKQIDHINEQMALFGDLPEDYPEFIEKQVFGDTHFLMYSQKENHAYCTHCGTEFRLRAPELRQAGYEDTTAIKPKHNHEIFCPYCGKMVTAKSEGYSRRKMVFVRWSLHIKSAGEKVLLRYVRHIKDFSKDYRNPEVSSKDLYRTVHGEQEYDDLEWGEWHITQKMGWHPPCKKSWWWNPSEYTCPSEVVLYNTSWDILRGTCLQYSCTELYLEHVCKKKSNPWVLDSWWTFYKRHPYVEQFLKLGWYELTKELDNYRREAEKLFQPGKDICQTLQMTREQFQFLRRVSDNNPKMIDIQIMQYAKLKGIRMSEEDHRSLRRICHYGYDGCSLYKALIDLCEHTTAHRLVKWIQKQKKGFHISDWMNDYLKWARDLGKDLADEYYLLPPNFPQAHDNMQLEWLDARNKLKAEEFAAFNKALAQMRLQGGLDDSGFLHAGGLFIRAPFKVEELITEGEFLHHCVGTYIDRVISGSTMIFFIRKETAPEKPFYTLEWRDHRIIQCRGKRNCDMTPEVKAFTQLFAEKMEVYESMNTLNKSKVKAV